MAETLAADPFGPHSTANPFPDYARLREDAPVHRLTLPDGLAAWLVTRYPDVEAAFRDPRLVKNVEGAMTEEQLAALPPMPDELMLFRRMMLNVEPPDHTRLRKLVQRAFTMRFVASLRPRVQVLADGLLDTVEERAREGGERTLDLIDDFAFPLPIAVISEMLGVPGSDRAQFREWSHAVTSGFATDAEFTVAEHLRAFAAYMLELFELKRAEPGHDLISGLLAAEEDGDSLDRDELLAMVLLLLVAGHETTVNLIGNGVLALLQHPDQLAKLRQNPDLLGPAVEELLRYDGPLEVSTFRYAREDLRIGGTAIARGDIVLLGIAAADRDARRFNAPDALDIGREHNAHLAFGKGIHHCLGAPLARLEGRIAIDSLLRRMPDLRLAIPQEQLTWRPGILIRGLNGLPLAY